MQGTQVHHPELFLYTDMDSLIHEGHVLRKIDKLIDFTFVRDMTASLYSNRRGRPSIDPELYFRMQLIGYLDNIFSERKLCEAIHYNLAYRWFCKLSLSDAVPDHSSLSKIRSRIGEEIFAKFFYYVLELCKEVGLVDGKEVMTDGSLISANAGLDSMEATDEVSRKQEESSTDTNTLNKPSRSISNKTHVSRTDPDATLAVKNGSPRALKYKVHDTIDAKSRVILARKVTTGARHESKEYLPQLLDLEARLGIYDCYSAEYQKTPEGFLCLIKFPDYPLLPIHLSANLYKNTAATDFFNSPDRFTICQGSKISVTKNIASRRLQTHL